MSFNCPNCTILCQNSQKYCYMCNTQFNNDDIDNIIEADNSQKIIDDNYIKAYETIPEYFFPKNLIYLEGRINNNPVRFLLDTGAAISVMDFEIMTMLKLNNLLDRKFNGQVIGVGSKPIEGKLNYIEIQFDFGYVPASFSIIKDINTIILGMDFIQSFGLIIDFKNRVVKIGDNYLQMKI